MKINLIIIVMFIMAVSWSGLRAQSLSTSDYKLAIGIRAGETHGIDFKYNTNSVVSIEAILGLWSDAASFTGLYEMNSIVSNSAGLRWLYGAGGHVAFATQSYYIDSRRYVEGSDVGLGIDGILGLEYKIPPIPVVLNLDLKPFVEFKTGGHAYFAFDPGIGIKIAF